MRIALVLTSHDRLGNGPEATGCWLEELAAPYWRFLEAGAELVLATPKGGEAPLDPQSLEEDAQTDATRRFLADRDAMHALHHTHRLCDLNPADFDAAFYPGGHGPLWDLAHDPDSIRLIRTLLESGRPVAAVCHGPAVLVNVQASSGGYLVAGRRVTAFSNEEEALVGLTDRVPFSVQDQLVRRGAIYTHAEPFAAHVQVDGLLVTGQNPASSAPAAEALLGLLAQGDRSACSA